MKGITLSAAAKELGISHQALRKAANEGRVTPLPDGRFDVEACRAQLKVNTDFAQQRKRKRGGSSAPNAEKTEDETLLAARTRREIAAADLEEMEAAEKRGDMVSVAKVAEVWGEAGALITNEILAIPDRISLKLDMQPYRVIREAMLAECRRALDSLSTAIREKAA